MKVAVYCRKLIKHHVPQYAKFFTILNDFGWKPVVHKEFKQQLIKKMDMGHTYEEFDSHRDLATGIDLAVSIGGDGTFLKTVSFVRSSGAPVLGINMGRLGFLANVNEESLDEAMQKVRDKNYVHQNRSLLRVETKNNIFGEDNLAMNELTLHKKDTSSMITVHASLEGKYLNSYWADGLIVGTPTGSTAYSLSCGGPIITPGCQVHILTPIAPHNLNVRPVVVPDHMPIKLQVEGRDRTYLMSLDSVSRTIKNGTEVTVRKADFMINVVKFEENNFLDTIRAKMMWGVDKRN